MAKNLLLYSIYKKLSHIFQQWTDLPLILSSSPTAFFSKQKLNAESIGNETELGIGQATTLLRQRDHACFQSQLLLLDELWLYSFWLHTIKIPKP